MHLPPRLRIATLNCLNVALPGRRCYAGIEPYSPEEYSAKTEWLATMFDRIDADFLLVQEIFQETALADVVHRRAGGGGAYRIAAPLADDQNGKPRVGLVWRAPWQARIETIADFPPGCAVAVPERGSYAHFSRPLLLARVPWGPDGGTLTLLNVHLKSRRPEFVADESADDPVAEARAQVRSLLMRAAEAAAVRRLVIELTSTGSMLVLAGDFNDGPNAVTTQLVADTSWKDEDRPPREHVLFDALTVAQHVIPGGARELAFTVRTGGEPERIDHMFVSEALVARHRPPVARVVAVEIYNDHLVERRADAQGLAAGPDVARTRSDHGAVCATVELIRPVPA
ncbi:MAG TPA: endonuclease/exonuclease/phosphatase family protein [Burkholderiaceae bacterium]|nr:endonuclease/exonuclease/phosphatase family protein [Burkholderiaceae bacterium]